MLPRVPVSPLALLAPPCFFKVKSWAKHYELGTINRTANLANLHTTRNDTEWPYLGRRTCIGLSYLKLGLMNCLFTVRRVSGPSFRRARHHYILVTDLS